MDGDTPKTVEAVVTRGDRITFAGNEAGARATAGKDAAIHDLRGATMLPGFVDAHSHFSAMMQMASGLDLDDPSRPPVKIGRESCRGRVCQYVYISVVAGSLKKKKNKKQNI